MKNIQELFDRMPAASREKALRLAKELQEEFVGMNIDVLKAFFRCSEFDRQKILNMMWLFNDGVAGEDDRKVAEENIMKLMYPGPVT